MFDKSKKSSSQAEPAATTRAVSTSSSTTIGPSIRLKGEVTGEEDLVIQGEVEGNIQLKEHNLTVGEKGRIRADAFARTITVRGELTGDLNGVEKVTITASGKVRGNIIAPKVILEEGASFKGSIDMDAKAETPTLKAAAGSGKS